jgi:hydroxyethylthiazole kinase-like uncharacterized protein yjeF
MTSEQPPSPPALPLTAHKGIAGRVLCIAGSETMPGAAILTLRGAQRGGAGLVTLATFDKGLISPAAIAAPEAVFIDLSRSRDLIAGRLPCQFANRRDHVRVAGPGLGKGGRTDELVRRLICDDFEGPLVLDADGLNVIQSTPEVLAECRGPLVVTPHPGEAARLLGEDSIPDDDAGRLDAAKAIARAAMGICVLKGHHTVVTDGDRTYVNSTGNPGMATAGSGDVLTGILGAYLARIDGAGEASWSAFDAVCSAVFAHGRAGDLAAKALGQRAVTATGILEFLACAQLEME